MLTEVEELMYRALGEEKGLKVSCDNTKLFMSRVQYAKRRFPDLAAIRAYVIDSATVILAKVPNGS